VILVDPEKKKINSGILGDIAPSILDLMDVNQPEIMTQKSLIRK
jgi:2,3-bisphosphoglycerate-independent phosphoglycerate mutase